MNRMLQYCQEIPHSSTHDPSQAKPEADAETKPTFAQYTAENIVTPK